MSEKEIKERSLKEFLGEAEELLDKLNRDAFNLSEDLPEGRIDPETLNSVFRSAHTLKGISNIFGFTELSSLSHNLENILDSLRLGKLPFTTEIMELLFEGLNLIGVLLKGTKDKKQKTDDLLEKKGRTKEFIDKLNTVITKTSSDKLERAGVEIDKEILKVLTEYEEHRLKENIRQGKNLFMIRVNYPLDTFDNELTELNKKVKTLGEIIATLPNPATSEKDRILFDILVGTERDQKEISEIVDKGEIFRIHRQPSAISKKEEKPERETSLLLKEEDSLRSLTNTVRVDIERLDSIMNTVGELTLCRSMVAQISEKLKYELGFTGLAVDLYKVNKDLERKLNYLQSSLLEVRMVPLTQLFDRLHRMVRKLSIEEGKEIEMTLEGSDTELDKLIVEELADPLMHIIRNSLDHGIESPVERKGAGKTPNGNIKIKAYNQGNHVVIEVEDDGKGIDEGKVRKTIIENGLLGEDEALKLKKDGLLDYIFMSGFSTKEEVSEVSGRGVGMDVVKKNIARLSGTIDVETWKGKGTRLTLTLPITLAIIKALLVTSQEKDYAIPINSVLEILSISISEIKTIEKREVIDLRGRTLPLLRLNRFFNISGVEARNKRYNVVVVGMAEHRLGIIVDNLIGEQDVVIKPLGKILTMVKGIAGATDLGNQKTILVLDTGGIISNTLKGTAVQGVMETFA